MEKPLVISSLSNAAKAFALFSKHGDGSQKPPQNSLKFLKKEETKPTW